MWYGALFGFDSLHNIICVELPAGIDCGAAVREGGEEAHNKTEAVEQRRRTADDIVSGQVLSPTHECGVANEVPVWSRIISVGIYRNRISVRPLG